MLIVYIIFLIYLSYLDIKNTNITRTNICILLFISITELFFKNSSFLVYESLGIIGVAFLINLLISILKNNNNFIIGDGDYIIYFSLIPFLNFAYGLYIIVLSLFSGILIGAIFKKNIVPLIPLITFYFLLIKGLLCK